MRSPQLHVPFTHHACFDLPHCACLRLAHPPTQGLGDAERDFQLLLQRAADEAAVTGNAASSSAAKLQGAEVVTASLLLHSMSCFNINIMAAFCTAAGQGGSPHPPRCVWRRPRPGQHDRSNWTVHN